MAKSKRKKSKSSKKPKAAKTLKPQKADDILYVRVKPRHKATLTEKALKAGISLSKYTDQHFDNTL